MLVSVVSIGNSRGIRLPKIILDKFKVTDKMNMEVTDKGITLTPVKNPRRGWDKVFSQMHINKEDSLEEIPDSGAFEWEW